MTNNKQSIENLIDPAFQGKVFCLDTSALMYNPLILFRLAESEVPDYIKENKKFSYLTSLFDSSKSDAEKNSSIEKNPGNYVFISSLVEWEINNIKDNPKEDIDSKSRSRLVLNLLKEIKRNGKENNQYLSEGITLPNGGKIFVLDYDESSFLDYSKKLYQPTRDDRLIWNYKNFMSKYISNGNHFEIITEDNGFEGQVYDMIGKYFKDDASRISSRPLISERTSIPNPSENYTGILTSPIIISQSKFSHVLKEKSIPVENINNYIKHVSLKEKSIPVENINNYIKHVSLDEIAQNQFIKITTKEGAEELFLRKKGNLFVPLSEYSDSKKSVEKQSPLEDSLNVDIDLSSKNKIINYINGLSMQTWDRQYIRKMIKCLDVDESKKFIKDYLSKNPPNTSSEYSFKELKFSDKNDIYRLINSDHAITHKRRKNLIKQINQLDLISASNIINDFYRRKYQSDLDKKNTSDSNLETRVQTNSNFKSSEKKNKNQINGNNYSQLDLLNLPLNPLIIPDSEQRLFVDLLHDYGVPIVSFVASQGAGKTVFSIKEGLKQIRDGLYDKITYIRPPVVLGQDLGFMPGSFEKKIAPFMNSFYDALEAIYGLSEKSESFYVEHPEFDILRKKFTPEKLVSSFQEKGLLDFEVMNYMQGRTLDNQWIIADEAQYFSKDLLRMLIGRLGERSKLVIIGDFAQLNAANAETIKKYDMSVSKSGLSHLINNLKIDPSARNTSDSELYAHITINRPFTKRSRASNLANWI